MEKAKTLLEIARIISGNDDDVLAEIEESIDNIEAYAQEHLEEFEERNISIKYDSVEDLQWLVTVNILVRNNYVMQIQEDCSITDFGWSLKSLRTFKEYNLALDSKFEEAAYALSTGEMSSIVEAEGKYYIIRCTSDNDKAKTEVNKSAILADKKLAAFNEKFEEYEAGKYVEWNDSEWKKLSVSSAVIYNVKFEDIFNTITIN